MLSASVNTLMGVTGGRLLAGDGDAVFGGVCTDSRCVKPGSLFVALPGDRVDGHEFAVQAVDAGARAVLVTRPADELVELCLAASRRSVSVVRVNDALRALQELARYHRSRLHCAVVGVTGSTGKTSTKDLLTASLVRSKRVVATQGNHNNELGVPLTVLSADASTEVLVVEMGMRGMGQIAELCRIAQPTLGLVTNVGSSHIELLGSEENIASAKGELVRNLGSSGAAFLNGDDEHSHRIAESAQVPVTFYGLSDECDVRAENVELDPESRPSFDLVSGEERVRVALPVPGRHNVYNALAAAAVALHLGVCSAEVAEGLETAELTGMRMEVVTCASGVTVINDAYNANPTSMRAAVETLASMRVGGRRVAVLGDMAELGSLTELAHFRLGEQVARLGIGELVTVGARAKRIAEGALAEGMMGASVQSFADAEDAGQAVGARLEPGDVVLVKASRVMGLEAVVDRIVSSS
jgi:UDP-N-acetylmuramoyl-tripeptide--D-alanyl-D-alanine ligase